jgi:hypothetical protein
MNFSNYKTQNSNLVKYEPRYVGGHVTVHKTSLCKYVVMSWKLTNYLLLAEQKKPVYTNYECQVQ